MFCPKCGAWSPKDANFCATCGNKYVKEEPVREEVCPVAEEEPEKPVEETAEEAVCEQPAAETPAEEVCEPSIEEEEPFGPLLYEEDQFETPYSEEETPDAVLDLYGTAEEEVKPENNKIMSVSAYIVAFILSVLPVAGFIVMTIWAAGGAKNRNRSNFAVTVLILRVIFLALVVAALVCLYAFNIDLRATIMNWLTVGF